MDDTPRPLSNAEIAPLLDAREAALKEWLIANDLPADHKPAPYTVNPARQRRDIERVMAWPYRRALARLACDFDRLLRSKLRRLGAFESAQGQGYLALWLDESPNPWRRFVVRQIVDEMTRDAIGTRAPPLETHLTHVRNRAFIDYMLTQQVATLIAGGVFTAKETIGVFAKAYEYRGGTVGNLEQIWAAWDREHPIEQYFHADAQPPKPKRGRKPRTVDEDTAQEPQLRAAAWVKEFTPEDLSILGERRAMRVVRAALRHRRAWENWCIHAYPPFTHTH